MPKKLFKKTLSKTDVDYRMTIPMDSLPAFQIPEGEHQKEVAAVDIDGHRWSFRCCTRKKDPHPKPVLSSGWIKFVKNRGLKEGDEVIFSVPHIDGAEGLFGIEARKKIKVFGQDFWSNPL
ncbi:AP2/ERF and B3 domain-containing protein [Populus alba x Populus x berolinensis]|uniref:AP2/ERF and B3 domain-containing protein n=1 Tax=Populus alba x Populus x berolinensis TaxID=444605 RepID=A0AAD6W7W6_9ROSI|nr:AP2/ERF and B3 domain-containing protein [Populus alba x Populus x berolinensis]